MHENKASERIRWALVIALTAVGVWLVCAPGGEPDPLAGHDRQTCLACRIRHGGTEEELRIQLEAIRRLKEERAKGR